MVTCRCLMIPRSSTSLPLQLLLHKLWFAVLDPVSGLPLRLFDQWRRNWVRKTFSTRGESLSHHDAVFCDLHRRSC